MSDKEENKMGLKGPGDSREDRIEIMKILAVGLVSFLLGFGFVIFFLKPSGASDDVKMEDVETHEEESAAAPDGLSDRDSQVEKTADENSGGGYAPTPADYGREAPVEPERRAEATEKAPTVPPGRTPEGVVVEDDAFYLKCWDKDGAERPGADCDELEIFEKRLASRLYVVDECRREHAGVDSVGKLSLGVEVDVAGQGMTAWSGASTTLPRGKEVSTCVRERLAGLPLDGLDNDFERYRIFFTIHFGGQGDSGAAPSAEAPSKGAKELERGKTVEVIWDNVRVRKEPVSGAEIGKISSGNKVKLLDKKDGWCKVMTPNNNVGWMTCEALSN